MATKTENQEPRVKLVGLNADLLHNSQNASFTIDGGNSGSISINVTGLPGSDPRSILRTLLEEAAIALDA